MAGRIDRGNQLTGVNEAPQLTGIVPIPNLPIATGATLGIAKPGTGLGIDGTGALSATSGGSAINQLTGDVTAGPGVGSQAASVVKVNGAAVPASQGYVGTNGSSQIIAATTPAPTANPHFTGSVGIGTATPHSPLSVVGLPVYANNAAAITGGLAAGDLYRSGGDPDLIAVTH